MPRARNGSSYAWSSSLVESSPGAMITHRVRRAWPQHAEDRFALKRDLDALARRAAGCAHAVAIALDRLHVRGAHLLDVLHEDELGEVVVDAGADQVLAGGQLVRPRAGLAAEASRAPRRAPTRRQHQSSQRSSALGDVLEVGEQHAVGNEPRRPMRDRGLNPCVDSLDFLQCLQDALGGKRHARDARVERSERVVDRVHDRAPARRRCRPRRRPWRRAATAASASRRARRRCRASRPPSAPGSRPWSRSGAGRPGCRGIPRRARRRCPAPRRRAAARRPASD